MFKSIASFLIPDRTGLLIGQDPTLYYIETSLGKYEGTIMYQDDVVIKLHINKTKPVKILKTNINRIQILPAAA